MALALFCSCLSAQDTAVRKRIAVLNFDNPPTEPDGMQGLFGADGENVGKGVSILLIEKLVQGGNFLVVDRSALEKLLKEQSEEERGRMDVYAMAARIGRMVGLDAMIIGAVTRYGVERKSADTRGGGGAFSSGVSRRKSKAYVDITAQVFDVTTGKIMGAFQESGESERTGDITVIAGHRHGADSVEMLGGEFVDTLFPEATRVAADRIAAKLNAFAGQIPPLHIAVDGLVAEVSGKLLTLNVGRKAGVRVGERLVVVREPPAAFDPKTTSAPVPERIGVATVTDVSDDSATAAFAGESEPAVGDHVRDVENTSASPE